MTQPALILATQSKYRIQLLKSTGVRFRAEAAHIDEYSLTDSNPSKLAMARAIAKAEAVARKHANHIVIGADQILEFEGQSFDKVQSPNAAEQRLHQLQGKTHQLINCIAFVTFQNDAIVHHHQLTEPCAMTMRTLTDDEINQYVETDEWRNSVGCYKIEGKGVNLFDRIDASESAIIGLPLLPILRVLRTLKINPLSSTLSAQ